MNTMDSFNHIPTMANVPSIRNNDYSERKKSVWMIDAREFKQYLESMRKTGKKETTNN